MRKFKEQRLNFRRKGGKPAMPVQPSVATVTNPEAPKAEAPAPQTPKPETSDNSGESSRNPQSAPRVDGKHRVHNLIILDESGSMGAIYTPALSGVNETLQTIREAEQNNLDFGIALKSLAEEQLRHLLARRSNAPAPEPAGRRVRQSTGAS